MKYLRRWQSLHALCVLALVGLLVLGCGESDTRGSAEKLALARSYLRAERYYTALSLLHDIPRTEEQVAELDLMAALAYFKLEDYPQATRALEQATPTSPALQIFLAYLYLLTGDATRASGLADTIESLHGPMPDVVLLKGNISLKAHQYQQAERHFRTVLAMDPTSVKAAIGLGHAALLQRRLGKAEEYYLQAVFSSVDEISPQLTLANYYLATQRDHDAEETLKLALVRYPGDVTLQMLLVHLYVKRHRHREAIDLLERVLDTAPFTNYVKAMAIRQYFALGRLDTAHQFIEELLSRDRENYHGLILSGEYHFRKHRYELALNFFHKALTKNTNSHRAHYYIGVIHLLLQNTRLATYFLEKSVQLYPDAPHAHLLLAAMALQSRKYGLASDYAQAVLELAPGHRDAHLVNGIAHYMRGHFEVSRYEFEVAAILEPQNPAVKILLALIALEQPHSKEAERAVAALRILSTEAIFLRAQMPQGRPFETASLLPTVEPAAPADGAMAWVILGHFYAANADEGHAESAYRQAMTADRSNVLPYYALAQIEVKRANRQQAIAYLEQAIAINPVFTKSYRALGSLYEQEGNYSQARNIYTQGLRYAPEDAVLLNNLAWTHLMPGGDAGTAYVHIRQAITLLPDDPDLQDTLAWWYYLADDPQQAMALLKKIVKARPEHPIYQYHLGMVYLKSGDAEQARGYLQRALDLGIEASYRPHILEQLR